MKEKLYKICEEVLKSEGETKKFLSYETLDELYEYFLGKIPELTKDEFDEFICEVLDGYAKDQENISKLGAENLGSVSGGAFDLRTKIASGALALLSMLPAAGAANVKQGNAGAGTSKGMNITVRAENTPSVFKRVKAWVKAHPKLTVGISLASIVLMAVGGKYVYNRMKKNNSSDSSKSINGINMQQNVVTLTQDEAQLIDCISRGDVNALSKFLSEHKETNLNFEDQNKKTPLMSAVESKNTGVLDLLLEDSRINLNKTGDRGKNILMFAVEKGNKDSVEKLLNYCKDNDYVNRADDDGNTALIIAAKNKESDILELLLRKGAKVDHQNTKGDTALICAARVGNTAVVEKLFDYMGINDINKKNNEGKTALVCALENGNKEFAEKLLARKGIAIDGALPYAAKNNYKGIVEGLLERNEYKKPENKDERAKEKKQAFENATDNELKKNLRLNILKDEVAKEISEWNKDIKFAWMRGWSVDGIYNLCKDMLDKGKTIKESNKKNLNEAGFGINDLGDSQYPDKIKKLNDFLENFRNTYKV